MTIAACYISPEGVVFGADSTASRIAAPGGFHYFNHNQKLFELGEGATLGAVTWGLGGLPDASLRTLLANLADQVASKPPKTVEGVAEKWSALFWDAYRNGGLKAMIDAGHQVAAKQPYIPSAAPANPDARSEDEEKAFQEFKRNLVVGFCIGGYMSKENRTPSAYEIIFDPLGQEAPKPKPVKGLRFWGAPNMVNRLIFGCDDKLVSTILKSGKWAGTQEDLLNLVQEQQLSHGILPIRDAIDFVHTCIFSTIKALKFSQLTQICGGPIELAVVTTDRKFRWVRHKDWDVALTEGMPS